MLALVITVSMLVKTEPRAIEIMPMLIPLAPFYWWQPLATAAAAIFAHNFVAYAFWWQGARSRADGWTATFAQSATSNGAWRRTAVSVAGWILIFESSRKAIEKIPADSIPAPSGVSLTVQVWPRSLE